MATEDTIIKLNIEESSDISSKKDFGNKKKVLTDYFPARNDESKTEMISKDVQVSFGICMSEDSLCSDLPSEKYWNLVAEKKRIELQDALDENERLDKLKESLLQQNVQYKKLLEEVNSFIEVFKEVAPDAADDTGIDVTDFNDTSD